MDITRNPLQCTCEMLWLKRYLQKQSQNPNMIKYKASDCITAFPLSNTLISKVPDDQFFCKEECSTEVKADCISADCFKTYGLTSDISAINCQSSKSTTSISNHFIKVKFKLSMSGANFQTLKLPYLKNSQVNHLNLSSNNISSIPDFTFQQVPSLQCLVLANNTISHVSSKTFQGLGQLLHLDLSVNKLKSLEEDSFNHLYHLQYLFLERNMLQVLNQALFDPLHWLVSLTLNGNPWSCICNDTMWYWLLNNQAIIHEVNEIRCHSTGEPVILSNRTCAIKGPPKSDGVHHNTHKIIIGSIAGLLAVTLVIVRVVFKYRFFYCLCCLQIPLLYCCNDHDICSKACVYDEKGKL